MAGHIVVIGDTSLDIDDFHEQVKERDGYPVLRRVDRVQRFGCAAAVQKMVEGLGAKAILQSDVPNASVKRRLIFNDKVLCRFDEDREGGPPCELPDADLVLIADYAWGVITPVLMRHIAEKYAGKEILVDWHPSRPLPSFYAGATAFKASWRAPIEHVSVPTILTCGAGGMICRTGRGGEGQYFVAKAKQALDPCGAGDMVLATLGVGRLKGLSWAECCEWASDNAAKVCQQWGSVPIKV
jgi:bifunctional ADP-heptose synthase (sugar kinase/adenylyltransferase)